MHQRAGVRVVEVERMHQHAVGERRRGGRDRLGISERVGLGGTAERASHRQPRSALVEAPGPDPVADAVEQVSECGAAGGLGDGVDAQAGGPARESAGGHDGA